MYEFMDDDFLLDNETARVLFHQHASKMPLFDYHCHLSAKEIWENKPFDSLGQLWLEHDHYKWRVMRACGVSEQFITGDASWEEKYLAFASALPHAIGNPVYHWTHLELQRFFGIHMPLDEKSAPEIWKEAQKKLSDGSFTPRHIMELSHVDTVCTTEDPADTLEYHKRLAEEGWKVHVLPAWRPDKALKIEKEGYAAYLGQLSMVSGVKIDDYGSLLAALRVRLDAFDQAGCVASDHDVASPWSTLVSYDEMNRLVRKRLSGTSLSPEEREAYKATLLTELGKEYARRNWVMEMHIGCERDQNMRGVAEIGEACGFDSTGDGEIAHKLGLFLNQLEEKKQLPKTVLFCLNPKDNWILAALANTFQDDSSPSKMQFGTAWWMQDHIPGMRMQLDAFSTTGVLAYFIGMLTDSRSFLSYPRHEYFRRILCNWIGEMVESGQYPSDMERLGKMVEDISFGNAKRYFTK